MVSGGGDDYLLLWDWREGKILHRINLQENLSKVQSEGDGDAGLGSAEGNRVAKGLRASGSGIGVRRVKACEVWEAY